MSLSFREAKQLAGLVEKVDRREALATVAVLIIQYDFTPPEIGAEMRELYLIATHNELHRLYERTPDAPDL